MYTIIYYTLSCPYPTLNFAPPLPRLQTTIVFLVNVMILLVNCHGMLNIQRLSEIRSKYRYPAYTRGRFIFKTAGDREHETEILKRLTRV